MSNSIIDLPTRLAELEAQVAQLQAQSLIVQEADEALEIALRDRLPLDQTLRMMLPILVEHVEAAGVVVRTYDENLELRDFASQGVDEGLRSNVDQVVKTTNERDLYTFVGAGITVLGQHLDVAGQLFGATVVMFEGELDDLAQSEARLLIDAWCEVLDNYLFSIAESRRKHRIIRELSDALREPVLDVGIDKAIAVLQDNVPFDDLLLVFRNEEEIEQATIQYKIIQGGELTHDSALHKDMDVDEFIREHADKMIRGTARDLLDKFDITGGREEVMISGVREERILGRVVITSTQGAFNTFDRDLVERFADHLRQRIVDFNREFKHLSMCFPDGIVHRLLHEERYAQRFLRPREMDVAVMFCDISGFTRISEQVLREPALIGQLVDAWSERVVEILWETGGVFDKMVGDCVIGMWGPPFFEIEPRTACRRAAEAAREIRAFTRTLNDGALIPALAGMDEPIGVATGLSYCSMNVGLFGPNENYTGFSSGMNNAARLQGVAQRDEILCMDGFVRAYADDGSFSEELAVKAKNVAEPLRYRRLVER